MFEADFFELAVEVLAPFVAAATTCPSCPIGGGLGVAYVEGEEAPTITQWGAAIRQACDAAGIAGAVTAEPGRAIVAAAGVTLYTVGTIKDLPGIRTYVSVDGGMSDNPRPVLYGSGYETFLPRAVGRATRTRAVTVLLGKHLRPDDSRGVAVSLGVRPPHGAPPRRGNDEALLRTGGLRRHRRSRADP